jgi:hypothetical protein
MLSNNQIVTAAEMSWKGRKTGRGTFRPLPAHELPLILGNNEPGGRRPGSRAF